MGGGVNPATLKMAVDFHGRFACFLSFSVFLAGRADLFRAVFCISGSSSTVSGVNSV